MNDSGSHQLQRGKREELGGAARQRWTPTPPGPAPRLEARVEWQGAGRPGLAGPWLGVLAAPWGMGRGRWGPPPSFPLGPRRPSLPPLLLPFPPLGVELHMRLLPVLSRPATVAQERVPEDPSRWQGSNRLSGVAKGWGRGRGSRASDSGRLWRPWATLR